MNAKKIDKIASFIIYSIVTLVILLLVAILSYILFNGVPDISWHFLTTAAQSFSSGGGIRDQLFNSLYLLVLTIIVSLPIALGAGIYLSEYASDNWFTDLIRTSVEVLSSLPSVVVGLFGYLLFVIKLNLGFSILSGAIALTFFNLPLLTRNIEESLRSVPNLQKEAGISLGLSNWKATTKIILPAALPGILTGLILSAGRIFGEAAALIYTAGQSAPTVDYSNWNVFSSTSFLNPMRPAETLAVHIWKVNTESVTPDAHLISSASSAVLIIVILIFNLGARFLGNKLYKKLLRRNEESALEQYNLSDRYITAISDEKAITTKDLQVHYGANHAIFDANLEFPRFKITSLIGASGSGKSTFLRCLNRMNDKIAQVDGQILYRNVDINSNKINVYEVRKHIGMVFQRPNPFAKSIKENITFALKNSGITNKNELNERLETSLKSAALWDEVKDNLNKSALALSGGQQQRLCIARSIAMRPDILLLDEPASALDPISTSKIEETLKNLSKDYSIIIVTHNLQQASRISDYTAFFHLGHIIEYNKTVNVFTNPKMQATEDYVSGNFG